MTACNRHCSLNLRLLLVAGILVAACLYVGSYCRLSREGMREAKEFELEGFLYVPFDEAAATEDLTKHHQLASFYAPLNWIDRTIFGADGPTKGILWRIAE